MKIEYDKLTEEQLEEFVEFIDWTLVPTYLLTEEIEKKFSCFPQAKARIWFERFYSELRILKSGNHMFFFQGREMVMDLNLEDGVLFCDNHRMWQNIFSLFFKTHDQYNFDERIINTDKCSKLISHVMDQKGFTRYAISSYSHIFLYVKLNLVQLIYIDTKRILGKTGELLLYGRKNFFPPEIGRI